MLYGVGINFISISVTVENKIIVKYLLAFISEMLKLYDLLAM